MKPQMTKLAIIEELFDNGYCKKPETRAITKNGECVYHHKSTGNKCAVGSTLDFRKLSEYSKVHIEGRKVSDIGRFGLEDIRLKRYQGHDIEFWQDLQDLHDEFMYWKEEGLNVDGELRLGKLKEKYK